MSSLLRLNLLVSFRAKRSEIPDFSVDLVARSEAGRQLAVLISCYMGRFVRVQTCWSTKLPCSSFPAHKSRSFNSMSIQSCWLMFSLLKLKWIRTVFRCFTHCQEFCFSIVWHIKNLVQFYFPNPFPAKGSDMCLEQRVGYVLHLYFVTCVSQLYTFILYELLALYRSTNAIEHTSICYLN